MRPRIIALVCTSAICVSALCQENKLNNRPNCFTLGTHERVTDSLSGLPDASKALIKAANLAQDLAVFESAVHFDNCCLMQGAKRYDDKWKEILAKLDKRDRISVAAAMTDFGAMLHTVQDFYAHSNWVEYWQAEERIKLWSMDLKDLPKGAFNGYAIYTGTFGPALGRPKVPAGVPDHDDLNKDSATSSRGAQKVGGTGPNKDKTYFELAVDVAARHSAEEVKKLQMEFEKRKLKMP